MTTLTHRHKRTLSRHPNSRVSVTLERFVPSQGKIDREKRVIHGVKVLGMQSRNPARVIGIDSDEPYSYTREALEAAANLYEGIGVYVDHPEFRYSVSGERQIASGAREVGDRFGRLVNVVVTESGMFADLEYLAAHPLAEMVLETAERMPEQLALSHHAITKPVVKPDGRVLIEQIIRVESVDLIGEKPGTTKSLFESEAPDTEDVMKLTIKKILEACGPKSKGAKHLKTVMEMDGMDSMGDMPVEMEPEASADDQMKAAFKAMIMAAVDDESLDSAATVARIKEILAAQEKLMSGAAPEPTAEAEATDEEAMKKEEEKAAAEAAAKAKREADEKAALESSTAKQLAELKARETAREMLETANADLKTRNLPPIEITSVRVKSVAALESADDRKALIKTWESATPAAPTRSGGRLALLESAAADSSIDTEKAASSIAFLRGRD